MEDNKYYKPSAEEFHIGFEYEILSDGEWKKTKVYYHSLGRDVIIEIKNIGHWSSGVLTRVKYLDREDIESLGWLNTSKHEQVELFNFKNKSNRGNELKLLLRIDNNWTVIQDGESSIFCGCIKNKSELKKLMQQLLIL